MPTTSPASTPTEAPPARSSPAGPGLDRIVIGLLLAVAGVAWLLDALGVSVPWRMFPAAALVLVGLVLLAAPRGGADRSGLVVLGVPLLVLALAAGVGASRFAGPVGDRIVVPAAGQWPAATQMGAGTVTVDLSRHPLPPTGRLDVRVGAGRIVLVLPQSPPRVEAAIVAGAIVVDGVRVGDGLDVHWSQPRPAVDAEVVLEVGMGDVEVRRE